MADITIKDLTAGTPLLTDLLIFANPTTGLAKKSTFTTLNGVLTLAGLSFLQPIILSYPHQCLKKAPMAWRFRKIIT